MPNSIGSLVRGERLVAKLLQSPARVVEIIAPAGFGKTSLALALGKAAASYEIAVPTGDDLARELEAHGGEDFVAILDDVDRISETQIAGIASAIELALPRTRIVLCSRLRTRLHRGLMVPPNERLLLTADDLAFRPHEALGLFEDAALDETQVAAMIDYCGGWPIAILSMRRHLDVYRDIRAVTQGQLHSLDAYLMEHVLGVLTSEQRDALLLCAGMPGLRREQIVAALEQPACAFELVEMQIAAHDAFGGIVVRPLLQNLAHRSMHAEMRSVLCRAANRLASRSATYAAAAYLAAGDVPAANDVLSALASNPKQLIAFPFHALSVETRAGLDAGAINAYPELWVALFMERQFQEDPGALLSDARQIAGMLTPSPLRNAVLAMGALLAVQTGRVDAAYELLQITTPAGTDSDDALLLKSAQAMLDSHRGDVNGAGALWLSIRKHFWGYHAWCVYMMLVEVKAARLNNDHADGGAIAHRMWQTAQNTGSSLMLGYAAAMNAFTAWLYHDDSRVEAYLDRLKKILTFSPSVHLQALADALSGQETGTELEVFPLYSGWAKLIAAASAPRPTAIELSRKAIEIGDACEDAALRILARLALGRLMPERRSELEAECRTLAGDDAVERDLASLNGFAARYDRANVEQEAVPDARLHVEVACGKIRRGDNPINASLKTCELIFALAVHGRPIARDTLFECLWPDQGPDDARSALKMCVHRARQQLEDPDAIVVNRGTYALGEHVVTDCAQVFGEEMPANAEALFYALGAGRPGYFTTWEWFAPFESRLITKTAQIGLMLANQALHQGDVERALHFCSVLTKLDPCDETATELAIRAHLQRGEHNQAVSRYRTLMRSLKEQLGVEPSETLRALVARGVR